MIRLKVIKEVKGQEKKFDRIIATINGQTAYDPFPISYLRVSEVEKLQDILDSAYELGYAKAEQENAEFLAGEDI